MAVETGVGKMNSINLRLKALCRDERGLTTVINSITAALK